jgi:hypothetical protein
MKRVTAKGEDQLDLVNDEIHDCWFSIDRVEFDADAHTVVVPFSRDRRGVDDDASSRANTLKLEDSERIGVYDFNTIDVDEQGETLRVTNC